MPLLRLTALSGAAALLLAAGAFGALTPTAYRAQANAICAHGIDQRFALAAQRPSSAAELTKSYVATLAIAQQEYVALSALKPPAALVAGHRRALLADWYVLGALEKIVKLPAGGTSASQAAWVNYAKLFGSASKAWAAVGVTQCQGG